MPLCCKLYNLLLIASLFILAASASSYHNYQYDMAVPQFTPDGRLLQVEYASEASQHSAPIVAARLKVRKVPFDSDVDDTNASMEQEDVMVIMTLRSTAQERLVVMYPEEYNFPSPCKSDLSVKAPLPLLVVALSGVVADSSTLLQKAVQESINKRQQFGHDESDDALASMNSPHHFANTISRACQQHAFGGGLRPFGSTIILAGCNVRPHSHRKNFTTSQNDLVALQTDPSGAVRKLWSAATGDFVVIGGGYYQGFSCNTAVKRKLEANWNAIQYEVENGSLKNALAKMAKILVQESKSNKSPLQRRKQKGHAFMDESIEQVFQNQLEVVVLSVNRGVYKLSQTQANKLQSMH